MIVPLTLLPVPRSNPDLEGMMWQDEMERPEVKRLEVAIINKNDFKPYMIMH